MTMTDRKRKIGEGWYEIVRTDYRAGFRILSRGVWHLYFRTNHRLLTAAPDQHHGTMAAAAKAAVAGLDLLEGKTS